MCKIVYYGGGGDYLKIVTIVFFQPGFDSWVFIVSWSPDILLYRSSRVESIRLSYSFLFILPHLRSSDQTFRNIPGHSAGLNFSFLKGTVSVIWSDPPWKKQCPIHNGILDWKLCRIKYKIDINVYNFESFLHLCDLHISWECNKQRYWSKDRYYIKTVKSKTRI